MFKSAAPATANEPSIHPDALPTQGRGCARCRQESLWLAVILLLALTIRTAWPSLAEFKYDEARLTALALDLTLEGKWPLAGLSSSAGYAHPPVSVYLFAPVFLFTTSPLVAVVYSGLMGVSAVVLCWAIARRWAGAGPWGHRLAALLLAASPWLVVFTRKVWQIAFVPALALVFIALVISALVEGRRWHLAWALFAYALLLQVHPSAITLAPALLLWLVLFRRQVKSGPLVLGALLGLATTLPFLVHQIQGGWPMWVALQALPPATTDLEALWLAAKVITGSDIHALAGEAAPQVAVVPWLAQIFQLSAWLVVAGLLLLTRRVVKDRRTLTTKSQAAQVDLVLISWLAAPVLLNLRHNVDLHLHAFALIAPAAYLIVGRAVDTLVGPKAPKRRGRRSLCATWLATSGGVAICQVTALVLMARFVANQPTPGGFGRPLGQVLDAADQAVAAIQETGATEVLVVSRGDSPATDATPAIFDVLLRGRAAYRFVDARSTAVFPPHSAVAIIAPDPGEGAALYKPWQAETLPGGYRLVHLDDSWSIDALEPFDGPRTFENGVELQGYHWQDSVVPGNEARLWLLWQVLWLSTDDSHFFVHILDSESKRIGQHDRVGYPTAYRRAGDRILAQFRLPIVEHALPGPYSAKVGMYWYPEVVNLSLLDDAGNPAGETLLIETLSEGL